MFVRHKGHVAEFHFDVFLLITFNLDEKRQCLKDHVQVGKVIWTEMEKDKIYDTNKNGHDDLD